MIQFYNIKASYDYDDQDDLSNEIHRAKHLKFCELFKNRENEVKSTCNLHHFNFTFFINFRQKRSIYKSLNHLTEYLSSHASCETKYMRYNFWNERLEYLDTSDDLIWYEGKKLIEKQRPEVYIVSKANQKHLIFKCRLPAYSDVHLSIKDKSVQLKRVTVSGYHLRLNFLPLDEISINLAKANQNTNMTTKSWYLNLKQSAHIDKYIVYYDKKCRQCIFNLANSTIDSYDGFLNPKYLHSIKCWIKVNYFYLITNIKINNIKVNQQFLLRQMLAFIMASVLTIMKKMIIKLMKDLFVIQIKNNYYKKYTRME